MQLLWLSTLTLVVSTWAQSSTVSHTSIPTNPPTPTIPTVDAPATSTYCAVVVTEGANSNGPVALTETIWITATVNPTYPADSVCRVVFEEGGGTADEPIFSVAPDGTLVSLTAAPDAEDTPGVTDWPRITPTGPSKPVIAGAVIGSVLGLTAIGFGLFWLRKNRRVGSSGDRTWVMRPGGWVKDEKRQSDDIALKEQRDFQARHAFV